MSMAETKRKHYFGVDFDTQRAALLQSRAAAPFLKKVISKADAALNKTYEVLKISEYMEFCENGNRKNFEWKYFERRNNASYLSIALWLTRDGKYIKSLTDHVFVFTMNLAGVCRPILLFGKNDRWKGLLNTWICLWRKPPAC